MVLALDSPLKDPNSTIINVIFWIDAGITIIFLVEALIKIFSFGLLINGKNSYLRRIWNQIDFLIVILSFMSLSPLSDTFKSIKMLRIFRALRLVTRNDGLKVAVRALLLAVPIIANVTIIMVLFFVIFGVISVSCFKGSLYKCRGTFFSIGSE